MRLTILTLQNKKHHIHLTPAMTVGEFLMMAKTKIPSLTAMLDDEEHPFDDKTLMTEVFAQLNVDPSTQPALLFLRYSFTSNEITSVIRFSTHRISAHAKRERDDDLDVNEVNTAMKNLEVEDDPAVSLNLAGLSVKKNKYTSSRLLFKNLDTKQTDNSDHDDEPDVDKDWFRQSP